MAFEVKNFTGSLFRNKKKETEKHPDYTGSGMYQGEEFWISAWLNEAKSGEKYFSFKFKPKLDSPQSSGDAQPQWKDTDGGSDVPF